MGNPTEHHVSYQDNSSFLHLRTVTAGPRSAPDSCSVSFRVVEQSNNRHTSPSCDGVAEESPEKTLSFGTDPKAAEGTGSHECLVYRST